MVYRDVGPMDEMDAQQLAVRKAARALVRAGLVGPYGHCSVRISQSQLLVCAAKPMGTILAGEAGALVPIDGALPEGVLGEVRVHQQIYQRRPDVNAICRVLPPQVMAMSVLGRRLKQASAANGLEGLRSGCGIFSPLGTSSTDPPTLRVWEAIRNARGGHKVPD